MFKSIRSDSYLNSLWVVAAARRDRGLTQAELAGRLNKPQSYISKIETGERRLDIAEFYAIAVALEVDPTALFQQVVTSLKPKAVEGVPS
ncbi:MAG: XRE family transcriptional regulator [Alphaproteobacteria bacterium]|nr:MAG: XRE family transcriptional regulator [Alphaproteobacteria bacterium]